MKTQVNPRAVDFQANAVAMRALVDDLHVQLAKAAAGGGEAAPAKHTVSLQPFIGQEGIDRCLLDALATRALLVMRPTSVEL